MIRKLVMLGVLCAFMSAATAVFAEDVFVTSKGSKYHKETCRLVKNKENIVKYEKQEAVDEGYSACKRCYKEDVKVEEKTETKESE